MAARTGTSHSSAIAALRLMPLSAALMALLAYRHGLRAAEFVDLRWEQIDFKIASLHVRRVKNGDRASTR
jgi:integrase